MARCKYCKALIPERVTTQIDKATWMRIHIKIMHREKIHQLALHHQSWGDAIIK